MKIVLQLFLVLCLSLASFRSMAMATNYVLVSCEQEHAVIKSDYAEELPPLQNPSDFYLKNYGQTNECRLKSGHIIRVRLGFDYNPIHYLQHSWVSVWLDRKKWLSSTSVEVEVPEDVRADTIDIRAKGVRICTVHGPIIGLDIANNDDKKQTPTCKATSQARSSNLIDTNEPKRLNASENPLVPPTILLGRGSSLCKTMVALNKNTLTYGVSPSGHLWLNYPTGQPIRIADPSPGKEWEESDKFDIDNSDSKRHVYHRSQSMGYWEDYDIYVVFDDAGYKRFQQTAMTDDDLLKHAEAVWPMDWSRFPNRLEAAKKMDKLFIPLSLKASSIKKLNLVDNHTHIIPFAYNNQTYLLLSNDQNAGKAFVIKPRPAGKFSQTCVFEEKLPNF